MKLALLFAVLGTLAACSAASDPGEGNEPTGTTTSALTRVVCQLPNGQDILPTVNSPPDWCTGRGGHLVTLWSPPLAPK